MEVTIERLGLDGDGIAGTLRMPGALPGERWKIDGPVQRLLEASRERVTPPCRHFATCGGCALQHASETFVAGWKRDIVVGALARRGLETEVRRTLTSPARSRRRAVLAGRRSRKAVTIGFHGRRSDVVVDVTECHVLRPEILAAKPVLAALTGLGASRSTAVRLTVAAGPSGLDVDVGDGRPLDAALRQDAARVAEDFDLARLSWGGEVLALRRLPFQKMGGAAVAVPPGAFLQATAEGQAALVEGVETATAGARRLADLFAGCGTFALALARRAEVRAVESNAAMLAALAEGARRTPGLRQVTTEVRDLFRRPLLPNEIKGLDAIVLDPPRAGAEAQCRALALAPVERIAMVSCNPVSFARDARLLVDGGYRLDWVQPVDQFRWSGHVELVAAFARP